MIPLPVFVFQRIGERRYDPLPFKIIYTKNVLIIKAVKQCCINKANAHISGYSLHGYSLVSYFLNNKCGSMFSYSLVSF